jgi:GNAT superfamily N-acetyltransferase
MRSKRFVREKPARGTRARKGKAVSPNRVEDSDKKKKKKNQGSATAPVDALEGLSGGTVSVHTVGHDKYAVLYKKFVRHWDDVEPVDPARHDKNHRTLCAVDLEDGSVVGVLTYVETRAVDTDGEWVPVYRVVGLCVRGDARRRGVGARLLSEMGRPAVVECSGREHEEAFYGRCGFSRRENVTVVVDRVPFVTTKTSEHLVADP